MFGVLAEAFCGAASAPRAAPGQTVLAFEPGPSISAVFAADPKAPAQTTAALAHVAGFRPVADSDASSEPVYSSTGFPLGISLGRWRAAGGTVRVQTNGTAETLVCAFHGLVPFGVYSMFLGDAARPQDSLQPLDGSGEANSFVAAIDGSAAIAVRSGRALRSNDVLVVVFHADGYSHGEQPGAIGANALEQLVAPLGFRGFALRASVRVDDRSSGQLLY